MNPLVAALIIVLSACGSEADAGAAQRASTALDTLVLSDDAELRTLASEMLPDLAARSGLGLRDPVRIERRSRAALEQYLRVKLDEELPEERARNLGLAYRRLGLVPDSLDLRELLLSVYLEQVAGFYDPDSTALFVLDDQPAETLRPLLLHELVHAVQDQWADLDALTGPEVGNDRRMAAQAAIEGHATLVMLEYMTEAVRGSGVDLASIPDMADQLRPALEAMREQYPALAAAPRVIQEGLLFPYLEGAGFVLRVWQARPERVAPFGPDLPASTEQVLRPERFLGEPPDRPTEVQLVAREGRVLLDDVLGQAELEILLSDVAGAPTDAAFGWDGDRWMLVAPADRSAERLVWASVWDDAASRDRVEGLLRGALDRFAPGTALDSREVQGRPMLVLSVGGTVPIEVTLEEDAGS